MRKTVLLLTAALAVCLSLGLGCSKKVSIEEGKARIKELATHGVPERYMSNLKIYISQMETAKRIGNGNQFRTYQDSLTAALAEFEAKMAELLNESGPYMDSLMKTSDEKIAGLRGLHLEAAQKGRAAVEALMQTESEKLRARNRLEAFALDVDTLVIQQRVADSLRDRYIGIWIMEREAADPRFKLVERTEIHMRPDGSLFIMEGKRGNISENAKEDWMFESSGTWDLMGDVAHHYITKEKRIRQIFEGIDPATGKWRKETQPPYDSTVAKGTKDRFASWSTLNEDFTRFPVRGKR